MKHFYNNDIDFFRSNELTDSGLIKSITHKYKERIGTKGHYKYKYEEDEKKAKAKQEDFIADLDFKVSQARNKHDISDIMREGVEVFGSMKRLIQEKEYIRLYPIIQKIFKGEKIEKKEEIKPDGDKIKNILKQWEGAKNVDINISKAIKDKPGIVRVISNLKDVDFKIIDDTLKFGGINIKFDEIVYSNISNPRTRISFKYINKKDNEKYTIDFTKPGKLTEYYRTDKAMKYYS